MMDPEAERIERERLASMPLLGLVRELAEVHMGDGDDLGVLVTVLRERIDRLAWTTEKPTKPGFYWYRLNDHDDSPVIVSVGPDTDMVGPWPDGSDSRLSKENGEWAGPLEPPA